jgi:hypothetical protein
MSRGAESDLCTALDTRDSIVLVTARSTYTFVVDEPEECRGLLSGGCVDADRTAFFCGAYDRTRGFHPRTPSVGERALFLVSDPEDISGFARLITSNIVEVRVVRSGGDGSDAPNVGIAPVV